MGVPPIISGTGKATDVKFGRYIYRVHPSKSPLKTFEKRDRGRMYPVTPQFWGVPPIISGTGKATDFKFERYIDRVYVNKSPLKSPGTVAICVVRQSCTFSRHPYIGRIARLSLRQHGFLVLYIFVFQGYCHFRGSADQHVTFSHLTSSLPKIFP